jgi:hypothetical protein
MEPPSTVWPFFYTRNAQVDYSFVLLPELLSKNREGMEALERCLEKDAAAGPVTLALQSRSYHVYFSSAPALLDGRPAMDQVGREIRAFVGVLSTARLSQQDADDLVRDARASVLGLSRLVWEGRKKEPVLSWGRAAAMAVSRVPAVVTAVRHEPSKTKTRWPVAAWVSIGTLCALGLGAGAAGVWAWERNEARWTDRLHDLLREKARAVASTAAENPVVAKSK